MSVGERECSRCGDDVDILNSRDECLGCEEERARETASSPDCVICEPMNHLGCRCNKRCNQHRDAVDPIDRGALADAYGDFHEWEAAEIRAGQLFHEAGERRAAAATRIRELGGKI